MSPNIIIQCIHTCRVLEILDRALPMLFSLCSSLRKCDATSSDPVCVVSPQDAGCHDHSVPGTSKSSMVVCLLMGTHVMATLLHLTHPL